MTSSNPQYFGKDLEAMAFARNYHQWIADEFTPYLGESVAEIGAGTGNFSDFLLRAGVRQLSAFEPSTNMYPLLVEKFADDERVDTFDEMFEAASSRFQNKFDAVVYVNVLEHIENDTLALSHAFNTLKPNGRLLVFVPALQFLYSELDRKVGHFRRYDKQGLLDVVRRSGFQVDHIRYFDILGIIPWYVAFTLLKKTTTASNVSIYDSLAVPMMRRIERLVRPPVGKNLLLIAHRQ